MKRLAHHRHTGRLLPHAHTSYAALLFILVVASLMLVGYSHIASSSDKISVSASVAGTVVIPPPVITQPDSDTTTTSPNITVSGTCRALLIVKIFVATQPVSAGICSAESTFSIATTLSPGASAISARQYDLADLGSDASNIIYITYQAPPVPTPTPPPSPFPSPVTPGGSTTPAVTPCNCAVVISSLSAVEGGVAGEPQTWTFYVTGGHPPYTISINWGDGQIQTITEEQAGWFQLKHRYGAAGNYQITATATDKTGQKSAVQVVSNLANPPVASTTGGQSNGIFSTIAWPIYALTFMVILSFALGERYQRVRDDKELGEEESEGAPLAVPMPLSVAATSSRLARPHKFRLAVLILLVATGLSAGVFALRLNSGPATGTVKSSSATASTSPTPTPAQTYTGHYFSFQYASILQPITPPDGTQGYLEVANFRGVNDPAQTLALAVQPSISLTQVPGVHLRQSQPQIYQQSNISNAGETGLIFTKTQGGFENTAFITHGDLLVTISLSDPNGSDLTTDFQQIMDSLTWR